MRDNISKPSVDSPEEEFRGWVRRKMGWKEAIQTGIVLGVVGFVFTFILHLY